MSVENPGQETSPFGWTPFVGLQEKLATFALNHGELVASADGTIEGPMMPIDRAMQVSEALNTGEATDSTRVKFLRSLGSGILNGEVAIFNCVRYPISDVDIACLPYDFGVFPAELYIVSALDPKPDTTITKLTLKCVATGLGYALRTNSTTPKTSSFTTANNGLITETPQPHDAQDMTGLSKLIDLVDFAARYQLIEPLPPFDVANFSTPRIPFVTNAAKAAQADIQAAKLTKESRAYKRYQKKEIKERNERFNWFERELDRQGAQYDMSELLAILH